MVNGGNTPTFSRGRAESIFDMTLASQHVAERVMEGPRKYSLRDHVYIILELDEVKENQDVPVTDKH